MALHPGFASDVTKKYKRGVKQNILNSAMLEICLSTSITPVLELTITNWRPTEVVGNSAMSFDINKAKTYLETLKIIPSSLGEESLVSGQFPGAPCGYFSGLTQASPILWMKKCCHGISCYFISWFTDVSELLKWVYDVTLPGIRWTFIE